MSRRLSLVPIATLLVGCSDETPFSYELSSFVVDVESIDGIDLPTEKDPIPANRGDREERWDFTIRARLGSGAFDRSFDGFVRLSVDPGAVMRLEGDGIDGRNIRLV